MVSHVLILLYPLFNRIKFNDISRVEIWNAYKLVLAIKGKAGQSFVSFFYLFNPFEGPLIILLSFDGF